MKIIIVGGGISGLSTFLSLKKYLKTGSHEIRIYEKHPSQLNIPSKSAGGVAADTETFDELSRSTAIVGGGLGVSPNGIRIIGELGQELHEAVVKQGFRAEEFVFRASRGWRLSSQPTGDKRIKDGEEVCIATSRHGLWQCLRDEVARVDREVLVYKKVVGVKLGEEHGVKKPRILFEDGEEEEADLVVGADGVRSIVKKGIFGEIDGKENFEPIYEGLIGVGGFIPTSSHSPIPACDANGMVFTFGPNGFFGYSRSSPTETMWWSTCEAENIPAETRISMSEMREQLLSRHKAWKDPVLHTIIEKSEVDSIYPVWQTPELPYWGKAGCVLVGDAAHALNPTSGQGSSQALEDTKTLAILLERLIKQSTEANDVSSGEERLPLSEALDRTIKLLYDVRNPRVDKIVQRTKLFSNRKKEQGTLEELMTCFFFWLIGKLPAVGKLAFGDVPGELYHWDVNAEIDKVVARLGWEGIGK